MWTVVFWKATAERALKTFAQSLAGALTVGAAGVLPVGWKQALIAATVTSVYSLVTSIGSSRVGDSSSPSLIT